MRIDHLIEEQCQKNSQNIAICDGEHKITYQQLNERAENLAATLQQRGAKKGDVVAVMTGKTSGTIIAFFAILKLGCIYLPIDAKLPKSRILYMIHDSNTSIILVNRETAYLPVKDKIKLDVTNHIWGNMQYTCNRPFISDKECAYIIYTSGTTGNPKGVMVPHIGVAKLKRFFEETLSVKETDKIGQFASISFDASVWEFVMALFTGAQLVLIPDDIIADTEKFTEFVNLSVLTIMTLPPHYTACLDYHDFSCLKKLINAGAPTTIKIMKNWSQKVDYINAYGPTETSICATALIIPKGSFCEKYTTVGKPILDYQIIIIDSRGTIMKPDETGEIVIIGEGVGLGYLNEPELTAQNFFEFKGIPAYKTGDLGSWDKTGKLRISGRIDLQVKIRGYRIELEEIKNALMNLPQVRDAAVIVQENNMQEKYICAYIVFLKENFSEMWLRKQLEKFLPSYMLPDKFIPIEKIPLNLNGKIDYFKLKNLYREQEEHKADRPNNTAEKMMKIWKEVLNLTDISWTDHFFEIGGQSLKSLYLRNAIRRQFQIDITISEIYHHPLLKDMINLVYQKQIKRGSL